MAVDSPFGYLPGRLAEIIRSTSGKLRLPENASGPGNPYIAGIDPRGPVPSRPTPLIPGTGPDEFRVPELVPQQPGPVNVEPDRSTLGPVAPWAEQTKRRINAGLGFPEFVTPPIKTDSTPAPKPQMRAVKLPNGTFLFTNRNEIGGDEVVGGPAAAGREIRAMDRLADPTHTALLNVIRSSTSDMPGAMVNASQDQAMRRGEGDYIAKTKKVPGMAPDTSGGTLSMIEGTPAQQAEVQIGDMMNAIALERAKQEMRMSMLNPQEAAAMATEAAMANNPTIQTGEWMLRAMGPQLDELQRMQEEELAKIDPRLDEKTKRAEEQRIMTQIEARRKNLTDIMTAIGKQAVTPYQ